MVTALQLGALSLRPIWCASAWHVYDKTSGYFAAVGAHGRQSTYSSTSRHSPSVESRQAPRGADRLDRSAGRYRMETPFAGDRFGASSAPASLSNSQGSSRRAASVTTTAARSPSTPPASGGYLTRS
eukprot:scaffold315223_cov41-Prasinocladus_malaysianus.AAC.1